MIKSNLGLVKLEGSRIMIEADFETIVISMLKTYKEELGDEEKAIEAITNIFNDAIEIFKNDKFEKKPKDSLNALSEMLAELAKELKEM